MERNVCIGNSETSGLRLPVPARICVTQAFSRAFLRDDDGPSYTVNGEGDDWGVERSNAL